MALTSQLFGALQDIHYAITLEIVHCNGVWDNQALGVHKAVRASITERRVGRGREILCLGPFPNSLYRRNLCHITHVLS